MNKKIFLIFTLIFILIFINSVNATENKIDINNSTDELSYSNSYNNDALLNYKNNTNKLEDTYNQISEIIVKDEYDGDGEYWVDDSPSNLKIKIKVGNKYTTDGKIIVECDGKIKEYDHPVRVGYDQKLECSIYGFSVGLKYITDVTTKSMKNVKITFIGNRYNVTDKNTGKTIELPKIKDSTINIKVRTGTKTIKINNEYETTFELSSYQYKSIKQGSGTTIYYLHVCTGTIEKFDKTTWHKKSVFLFKVGKTIKIGKKKFKSIKLAKKYVKNTFKVAFKGGKYIKTYKKGKRYYQLWKVPVYHFKNVKNYQEVKGEVNIYKDGPKLWYNFYNSLNQHVYQLDDLNFI